MSRYFLILFSCFVLTLPLEFVFKAKVYRRPLTALKAISLPIFIYLVWDVIATHYDHWKFSEQHSSSIKLLGLPLEEILFFVIIPLCALLTFESVKNLHPKSATTKTPKKYWITFVCVFVGFGAAIYIFRLNSYNLEIPSRIFPYYFVVTLLAVVIFSVFALKDQSTKMMIASNTFFYTILICLFFMVFVNGYLTILDDPVVSYKANLGPRLFFDIPIEDFFYGIVLLSWILARWVKYIKPLENENTKI